MKHLQTYALLFCIGVVAGCTGAKTLVVLKNPQTGQIAQCQDDARLIGSPARVDACAKAYEKEGWVRLTE
jgi:hypothetical protein